MLIQKDDPESLQSIKQAQSSIDVFLELYQRLRERERVAFKIKVLITSEEYRDHFWYNFKGIDGDLFIAECPDLPQELKANQTIRISKEQIVDWMINDHGHLYGGYSIRLQRSRLPENEKKKFDIYMGIKVYESIA